jgi:hypothetical protein
MRVMIDITGTPRWANGGQSPNHMPRRLADLRTFAQMLAARYNGRSGHGSVSLWSVWNEPNLQRFLTPQFNAAGTPVSPANYAKLVKTVYSAIKSANPLAKVAIGETSARGHNRHVAGISDSLAPGTFALLLSRQPGLRFDAWAHHPYPTSRRAKPLEQVRYPNVSLTQLPTFERQLDTTFHRFVPIWISEYGYETTPDQPRGVSPTQQASYMLQAMALLRRDTHVQMFIWFTYRDSPGNPWKSGIKQANGTSKPSTYIYTSFAHANGGQTIYAQPGPAPLVKMFVPYISSHSQPGETIGITYQVTDRGALIAQGEPTSLLAADQSIWFLPRFTVVKGHTYLVTATANSIHGDVVTQTTAIAG